MLTKEEHNEMKLKVLHAMVKEMGGQLGGFATKHLKDKYGALPEAPNGEAHEEPQTHTLSDAGAAILHDTDHDGDDDLEGMPKTDHPASVETGDHHEQEESDDDGDGVSEVPKAKDKAGKKKRPPRW